MLVTGQAPEHAGQRVMGFNPAIETLLQEHLFAAVFACDALRGRPLFLHFGAIWPPTSPHPFL